MLTLPVISTYKNSHSQLSKLTTIRVLELLLAMSKHCHFIKYYHSNDKWSRSSAITLLMVRLGRYSMGF